MNALLINLRNSGKIWCPWRKLSLGKVRTEHIKRIAKELVRRFPNKFSNNFEGNKRVVEMLVQGASTKMRNRIAGYITHVYSGMQMAPSSEDVE
jgi:small subunit ribosomal protein S17e